MFQIRLSKASKKPLILVIFLLIIHACSGGPKEYESTATNDKRFRAVAPSTLYFKNIRSIHYSTRSPEEGMEHYLLKKINTGDTSNIYNLLIAHNWLQDEAYVWLVENSQTIPAVNNIRLEWKTETDEGSIELKGTNPAAHWEFLSELYRYGSKGAQIKLTSLDNKFPVILLDEQQKRNFLIVLTDYYKLTEQNIN